MRKERYRTDARHLICLDNQNSCNVALSKFSQVFSRRWFWWNFGFFCLWDLARQAEKSYFWGFCILPPKKSTQRTEWSLLQWGIQWNKPEQTAVSRFKTATSDKRRMLWIWFMGIPPFFDWCLLCPPLKRHLFLVGTGESEEPRNNYSSILNFYATNQPKSIIHHWYH